MGRYRDSRNIIARCWSDEQMTICNASRVSSLPAQDAVFSLSNQPRSLRGLSEDSPSSHSSRIAHTEHDVVTVIPKLSDQVPSPAVHSTAHGFHVCDLESWHRGTWCALVLRRWCCSRLCLSPCCCSRHPHVTEWAPAYHPRSRSACAPRRLSWHRVRWHWSDDARLRHWRRQQHWARQ